jgi:hypothetical protein
MNAGRQLKRRSSAAYSWIAPENMSTLSSRQEFLLCATSVFSVPRWWFFVSESITTETQRTQRLHRENRIKTLPPSENCEMNNHTRTLKRIALAVVVFHVVVVVLHAIAHEVLPVKATPAQLAFIIPVIILAPVVAGFMLLKFEKSGMVLLTVSMIGSFVFGVYYHFIAETIDHVAHVARMEPLFWSKMFQATAYLLAISEMLGAVVGFIALVYQKQSAEASTTTKRGNPAF